jgi:hypothetical protein
MIRVDVWLPDPAGVLAAGVFGPGALIRIERADLALIPPYALGAYAEVHTTAIVAATVQYSWWDPAGIGTSSYQWRVSKATPGIPADYSDYSAPFTGTNPAGAILPRSYATLGRALALFETTTLNANRTARLATALGVATDELIGEAGDYFYHPANGTTAWTPSAIDIDGDVLHAHYGIVSLATLEFADAAGNWTTLTLDTDYAFRGTGAREGPDLLGIEPYFHIELIGPTYRRFPRHPDRIRLTGVRGWPAIPAALTEACAARARQLAYADPSYSGSLPSDDAYGHPAVPAWWPQVFYKFLERERHRFAACLFANDDQHHFGAWR